MTSLPVGILAASYDQHDDQRMVMLVKEQSHIIFSMAAYHKIPDTSEDYLFSAVPTTPDLENITSIRKAVFKRHDAVEEKIQQRIDGIENGIEIIKGDHQKGIGGMEGMTIKL